MKRAFLKVLSRLKLFDLEFLDSMVEDARIAREWREEDEAAVPPEYRYDAARWLSEPGFRRPQPGWKESDHEQS